MFERSPDQATNPEPPIKHVLLPFIMKCFTFIHKNLHISSFVNYSIRHTFLLLFLLFLVFFLPKSSDELLPVGVDLEDVQGESIGLGRLDALVMAEGAQSTREFGQNFYPAAFC